MKKIFLIALLAMLTVAGSAQLTWMTPAKGWSPLRSKLSLLDSIYIAKGMIFPDNSKLYYTGSYLYYSDQFRAYSFFAENGITTNNISNSNDEINIISTNNDIGLRANNAIGGIALQTNKDINL